ncbi:MAG: ABC-F family ATP-binding cassette domain-containing protein [Clostridia bacterium]|nr:ABC-F family ATP-binding cassette domain-containing protein [Clostridia bacterium]
MILIDINNLTVAFGEREILTSVTLQIQKGQCIGLTGLNGAGKTTLMKTVAGIYESTSGSISIQKGIKIGYLEQQHTATGIHTVLEEATKSFEPLFLIEERMHRIEEEMTKDGADITLLGERYEIAQREFDEAGGYGWKSRLTGVLKGLGLTEEFWDKPVDVLSGGEKTRLALARMLLDNNDVLLLDEPSTGLDINSIKDVQNFILYCKSQGKTILLSTHNAHEMERLCDNLVFIEEGKIVAQGEKTFLLQESGCIDTADLFFYYRERNKQQ